MRTKAAATMSHHQLESQHRGRSWTRASFSLSLSRHPKLLPLTPMKTKKMMTKRSREARSVAHPAVNKVGARHRRSVEEEEETAGQEVEVAEVLIAVVEEDEEGLIEREVGGEAEDVSVEEGEEESTTREVGEEEASVEAEEVGEDIDSTFVSFFLRKGTESKCKKNASFERKRFHYNKSGVGKSLFFSCRAFESIHLQ